MIKPVHDALHPIFDINKKRMWYKMWHKRESVNIHC